MRNQFICSLFLSLPLVISACVTRGPTISRNFCQLSDESIPGIPFNHFSTMDSYKRTIHFYLSSESEVRLPLFVFVAGSGCESNFWKRDDGSISNGYQGLLLNVVKGRGHVMVVEKPGVNLFESTPTPGASENCSKEFNEQQTLERWSLALSAAIDAAAKLSKVDNREIVLIGHSEGAISAAKVASINPHVTHVALLSGSGATQLFDFVVNRPAEKIDKTYQNFDYILSHPNDVDRMFWGHPSKRWASFMKESSSDLLVKTQAKVFVAHGTLDSSVPVQSFDFLVSDLKRRRKSFDFDRIENADHSLNVPGDKPGDGMRREFSRILDWADEHGE